MGCVEHIDFLSRHVVDADVEVEVSWIFSCKPDLLGYRAVNECIVRCDVVVHHLYTCRVFRFFRQRHSCSGDVPQPVFTDTVSVVGGVAEDGCPIH